MPGASKKPAEKADTSKKPADKPGSSKKPAGKPGSSKKPADKPADKPAATTVDLSLKCSHCGKLYSTRKLSVLRAHERMHTGELPFECLHAGCSRRFSRKDCMMVHYLKHALAHKCSVKSCGMAFGSAVDLFRHRRFHDSMCDICGESFQTLPLLRIHKLKDHNESEFKCTEDGCTLSFTTRHALKWHACSHVNKTFVCLFAGCSKMFKTREDLESHYHLEGHSATNTELPAESSTVSSRSCDAVPDPPCEIFDSEEEDADAGVSTSSVSGTTNIDRSLRTRLSSQKIRNCQDRAELVKNVQKTAIGAPKEVRKSLSSKSTEVVKESNMNLEKTAAITTLCEAEQATDVLLKTSTAQICDAAGSAISDVLSAGASVEQNVPVPASSASSLSDTGSLITVDTGDKSPDNMNAASVPPNGHNVTSCRPPRRAVRRDNIPSEKSSSVCARKTRRKINPSGSDKAAESNSKKRKTNDSDDNDNDDGDEHDDDYEDNSDGDDDPEADDSDYSKSDDNIDKRGALKGFDFRCPIKDCDRSFNKKSNLVAHITAVHSSSRPFVCTVNGCGQSFGFKHVLQRHHKNIHVDGKNPRVFVSQFDSANYISQSLLIGASTSSSQSMRKKKRRRTRIGVPDEGLQPDSDSGSDSDSS